MNQLTAYWQLMRLHRPIPILLLLWPTYWGLILANQGLPTWHLFWVFTLGVLLMRTAGCIFNDIADRNFDKHVERTKMRPITKGIISVKSGLFLAFCLCLIAFLLVLTLNLYAILLSFVALILALTYPLMKRYTHLPQVVLGAAFNFGIVMSFAASINHLPITAWLLYFAALCWTVAYDTWYALEDIKDDERIGIKSTARLFGSAAALWIILLQFIFLMLLAYAGYLNDFTHDYYVILAVCALLCFNQQHIGKNKSFIKAFSHNHWIGLLVFLAIATQYIHF